MSNKVKEDVIEYLPFPECIRRRVGMYLGSVENASICIREIIDNSTDELASGYGDTILISTNLNGYCFVSDNGRGIPITMSKDKPTDTQAYLSISDLHTGSKFSSTDNSRVGMNGIGSSSVSACSLTYILMSRITEYNYAGSIPEVKKCWESAGPRSKRDLFYIVVCEKGYKVYEGAGKLKDLEKMIFKGIKGYVSLPEGQSTIVLFKPDPEIFESTKAEIPVRNLQYFLLIQEKFFGRKLNVIVDGQKLNNTFKPYKFEVLKTIIPKDTSKNKQVSMYVTFEYDPNLGTKSVIGSVNGLEVNNGQHVTIAESCIKTALRDLYKIKHDCLLNGLQMCVILLASEVVFSEQIKSNLRSISKVKVTDFGDLVKGIIKEFKKDTAYWDDIVGKLNYLADSMKNLGAAEKAQRMMDSLSGVSSYRAKADFPKTFADATCKDRSQCELFIVEGNSAQSSLVMGRKDTLHHACLGIRGKILNVTDKSVDRALESKVICDIFNIIGLGLDVNWVGKEAKTFEEAHEIIQKRSRYGKIIIATDADADGSAIFNEIIYLFSKFARFLLDHGMVYRAMSPLFRGYSKTTGKITYYYPDDPFDIKTSIPLDLDTKKHYDRWKGLSSLTPETGEVYDSFYNPLTRRLILVTPDGINYSRLLNEDIDERKKLLYNKGVLSNPYKFKD